MKIFTLRKVYNSSQGISAHTRKYGSIAKAQSIQLKNKGFSEIVFNIAENLPANNVYHKIISTLYNILKGYNQGSRIVIIARFNYEDGSIRTIHKTQRITLNSDFIQLYLSFIQNVLSLKSNDYNINECEITHITFNFFFINRNVNKNNKVDKYNDLNQSYALSDDSISFKIGSKLHIDLPANMNYASWGIIHSESEINLVVEIKNIQKYKCYLFLNKETNQVNISGFEHSFTDCINSNGFLVRTFSDGSVFYIKNGLILVKTRKIKTEFMKKLALPKDKEGGLPIPSFVIRDFNGATLDIETVLKNGKHVPYLYAFYDGENKYTFFEKDPTNLFKTMLKSKYRGRIVYAHNLSRFDIVFLFKHIANLQKDGYKVSILKKEDKIISIQIVKGKNISITLKDSLLILPASLDKLAKQFKLEVGKLVEPVFVGSGHDKFKSNDLSHYTKNVEKIDDFNLWHEKIQEYCIQDCVALYQVLHSFHHIVREKWYIDITKFSTIPSLAFAIYRMHYMPSDTIPLTKGKVFNFLKQSYTGGSTEMYKPNAIGKKLYCYDVNSLYPAVMANFSYPCGQMYEYEGDPSILTNYWIGEASVSTKKDLYQPYLQLHHNPTGKSGGMRTIAPNGSFKMVINSCEAYNAKEDYNLDFTNSKGYLFEKSENLFSSYVADMYNLRKQYPKSDPMNMIAKLLLNSLYGRFGMAAQTSINCFMSESEIMKVAIKEGIKLDYQAIDRDLYFVEIDDGKPKGSQNVSVSLASAVTAYARVYMSRFKNNPNFNLYYTDTDSIFVDKPLPNKEISDKLGSMKLEYILKDAIFLAPKVYAGITEDDQLVSKVKGFTNSKLITLEDLEKLLTKGSYKSLQHTKWFKNLTLGSITTASTPYNLSQTQTKRVVIFNDDIAVDTKPITV